MKKIPDVSPFQEILVSLKKPPELKFYDTTLNKNVHTAWISGHPSYLKSLTSRLYNFRFVKEPQKQVT